MTYPGLLRFHNPTGNVWYPTRSTLVQIPLRTWFVFCFSFMGRGVIEASPLTVWEAVKNPLSRYIYDNMLKVRSFIMRTRDLRTTLHDSFNLIIRHRASATDKRTLYLCANAVYLDCEYRFRISGQLRFQSRHSSLLMTSTEPYRGRLWEPDIVWQVIIQSVLTGTEKRSYWYSA